MEQLTIGAGLSSFAFSFWKLYCMLPSTVLTLPFLVFIKYKQTNQQKNHFLLYVNKVPINSSHPGSLFSFFLLPHPIRNILNAFAGPFPPPQLLPFVKIIQHFQLQVSNGSYRISLLFCFVLFFNLFSAYITNSISSVIIHLELTIHKLVGSQLPWMASSFLHLVSKLTLLLPDQIFLSGIFHGVQGESLDL